MAARMLLGLTPEGLARSAQVSLSALEALEGKSEDLQDHNDDVAASVRAALEDAGIAFIDERATSSAGGIGVRLSTPQSASVDTNAQQTVQYPEMAKDGPFGAGG